MKKIVTALGSQELNLQLKKERNIEILCKDIQYQEGVLEIIEKYKKIDFLIISELIIGKNKFEELIQKIIEKNNLIKIICILENRKIELENILYAKGIYKIFYNNEIEIKKIIEIMKNEKEINNIENKIYKDELDKIKNILIENEIEINLNNNENPLIFNYKKYIIKLIFNAIEKNKYLTIIKKIIVNKKIKNTKKCKIISFLGVAGVGKSIATVILAKAYEKENKKILIIDFDILNNSLHTILDVDKYPKKIKNIINKKDLIKNKINIFNLIININKNIDLISGINLLFDKKYKMSASKIKFIFDELKKYYDFIIIDNSAECFFDYTKNIIKESDYSIFLIESNLLEVKKSKNLLNIYFNNWNIEKDKIKILINKYNKNSIDKKIINDIFKEYKLLGKINYNENYNLIINKNFNDGFKIKKIINEYVNICKTIK